MLKYSNINYTINKTNILNNISFEIQPCTITAIVGPNGSGKSTLIKILGMNSNEYSGEITYDNKIYSIKKFYDKISILRQVTNIPDNLTCEQFLELCYQSNLGLFYKLTQEDKQNIYDKMKLCDCLNIKDQKVKDLSGGQRQRVLICAAILKDPKLLILDEPTTFLDVKYQYLMMKLIKKLNKENKVTILLILHDINQAIEISDNLILLKEGIITYKGKSKKVEERDLSQAFDIQFKKHYSYFKPIL